MKWDSAPRGKGNVHRDRSRERRVNRYRRKSVTSRRNKAEIGARKLKKEESISHIFKIYREMVKG